MAKSHTEAPAPGRPLHEGLLERMLENFSDESEASQEKEMGAEALIADGLRENASDIHLDPDSDGLFVRLRIDGVVVDGALLDAETGHLLSNQVKTMAGLNPVPAQRPQEGRINRLVDDHEMDLRVAVAPCATGDKITLRILSRRRVEQQLHELGLDNRDLENIDAWLGNVDGMFMVAGPTGAGKTTTLYALLHKLKGHQRNIVTVEDPIEYHVRGINQIEVDLDHDLDFAEGIKSTLRLDPDYLLVGEVREPDSARASVNAAASGRALLTTLHSRDAVGVVEMLRNYEVDDHEIASNLMFVVAQRLVRRLCRDCVTEGPPADATRYWLRSVGLDVPKTTWHAHGCPACNGIGYSGRIGVFEVWHPDDEDRQLILGHTDPQRMRKKLRKKGHRFLLDDALRKVEDGVTTLEELRTMGGFGPPAYLD